MEFSTLRDIACGEEITVNYNGLVDDKSPMWFETE
jgi:SET domain-containing protein